MPVTSVWIPDSCGSVGDHAFRNCTKLTRIRIPKDCGMGEGVLEGCGAVTIVAPAGGKAESWALNWIETHPECEFRAE